MNWTALALTFLTSFSAFAGTAYYDGDDPNPAPLKYPEPTLQATLMQEMGRKKVTAKNEATGESDVTKFSRVEKLALLFALGAKPGAEFDTIIEDSGQFTPVQVTWDNDVLSLKVGSPRAEIYGKASTKEEIQKKYGVGPFVDSGALWDNNSLFVVEQALATLSKEELTGVAGLPFHRMVSDPSHKAVRGTAIAMYVPDKSQIELYNHGMAADKRKFVGPVDKPMPLSVSALVHECGHAIARKSARGTRGDAVRVKAEYDAINQKLIGEKKKYDEDKAVYKKTKDQALGKSLQERGVMFKQLMADMNAKKKEFEGVAKQMVSTEKSGTPMERAFEAKLPLKDAPTVYGRTAIGESFADTFALLKLDRAALDRAAPGVSAWFESPAFSAMLKD